MKCKDFTANIDLHEHPKTFWGLAQYQVHVSLCTFCREYLKLSQKLSRAIELVSKENGSKENALDIEKLNRVLLEKFKTV